MRRVAWAFVLGGLACEEPSPQIDIVFPDTASQGLTTSIVVTAVEPLVTVTEVGEERRVVECGQLGVFPPTARYSRDGSDVAGLEHVLLNRGEYRKYPLEGPWSLDIPKLKSSTDSNPWRAVMVHFEARGSAHPYERGLGVPDEKTLLEGCFCMRLDENASHSDAALDGSVKAACPAASTFFEAPLEVQFKAVAPSMFRLAPYGIDSIATGGEQTLIAEPGVKVTTTRCSEGGEPGKCFNCSEVCKELDDLKNVPIHVQVLEGPEGTKPAGVGVVLTDKAGRIVPEVEVGVCNEETFTVRASIVGRPEEHVDMEVRCVPKVAFGNSAEYEETGEEIKGITSLPGDALGGGSFDRAKLAVLSSTAEDAIVTLYTGRSSSLDPIAKQTFPGERARGIFGFYYVVGRTAAERDKPLLAVATTGRAPGVILRLYRFDSASEDLELVQTSSRACSVCACNQQRDFNDATPVCSNAACTNCYEPCDCSVSLGASNLIGMTANDLNGDGLADLGVAADSDVTLTVYYSSPSSPNEPPPLEATCKCAQLGKVLETYDLVQLGGPNETTASMDLIMGDGTGAFARYSKVVRPDGPSCQTDDDCSGGRECWHKCSREGLCSEQCPEDDGRCVRRCTIQGAACPDALEPTCTATTGIAGESVGYCAGTPLGCGQPASVWRLINIHHVTRGRFTDGELEDAVAVGAGSPVPGFEGTGQIRILFGANVDLTTIDSQAPAIRERSHVELVPRPSQKQGGPPQGPRSAEVADFNGDGFDDLAVIYYNTEEVRIWLGGQSRGPGELDQEIRLNECGENCPSSERCFPYDRFVATDMNGDGLDDIVVVCTSDAPTGGSRQFRLRWFDASRAVE
ncbi:MAG: VCBS repeat-containing protein [Deltaproteobacteria bacterium]|nr:VCBS repeat-containing protein [Deltaproteobacteria bacterium]